MKLTANQIRGIDGKRMWGGLDLSNLKPVEPGSGGREDVVTTLDFKATLLQSINCDSYININFKTKEKFKTLKGKRVNPGTSFGSKLAKYSLLSEQVKGENVDITTEVEFWSNGNVKEIKVDGSTFRMVGKKYYGEI